MRLSGSELGARIAAVIVCATALLVAAAARAEEPVPVAVDASPIERFDSRTPIGGRYGGLIFLGGLQLRAADPDFGGLSGLRLSSDGRSFTAISDRGNWFHGSLDYDGSRLAGVSNLKRAATPGRDGRPLPKRPGFDTEALEIEGGTAWTSAERVHWLTRYTLGADGFPNGRGQPVPIPPIARKAPSNQGCEAIAARRGGGMVMIAEKHLDEAGDNRAYVVGADKPFAFSVRRTEDFSPTDLARLPDGDYVLLERRYVPPLSLSTRIRRLAAADIAPGARADGPVLMEATLSQTIDNFEAISAYRAADGRTVITVLSDDNFSAFQRTLILQFALAD